VGVSALKQKKRRFREDNSALMIAPLVCDVKLEGDVDPAAVVAAFKVSNHRIGFVPPINTILGLSVLGSDTQHSLPRQFL
jgi:hypothetical protein